MSLEVDSTRRLSELQWAPGRSGRTIVLDCEECDGTGKDLSGVMMGCDVCRGFGKLRAIEVYRPLPTAPPNRVIREGEVPIGPAGPLEDGILSEFTEAKHKHPAWPIVLIIVVAAAWLMWVAGESTLDRQDFRLKMTEAGMCGRGDSWAPCEG